MDMEHDGFSYKRVVELNNWGESLLLSDLESSVHAFRTALDTLKGLLHDQSQSTFNHRKIGFDRGGGVYEDTVGGQGPFSIDSAFFLPIHLLPSTFAYADNPVISLSLAFVFVTFNLAQTYHCHAFVDETRPISDRLLSARSFYYKVLRFLRTVGIPGQQLRFGRELVDLVTMTSYNNLAQIAYLLSEFEESKDYFSQLLFFASSIDTRSYTAQAVWILEWQRMNCLNNMVLLEPPTTAAAA